MRASEAALALIKEFEGCRLEAYPDPATGGEPYTIGFGCTEHVYDGMRITMEEALHRLQDHLIPLEAMIEHIVRRQLTQNQFDALVSLCWNIGIGNFEHSTLCRLLKAGAIQGAADQFLAWNRADGHVMDGLTRRREAERALFLSPA